MAIVESIFPKCKLIEGLPFPNLPIDTVHLFIESKANAKISLDNIQNVHFGVLGSTILLL